MNCFEFGCKLGTCVAVAVLVGCGASAALPPSSTSQGAGIGLMGNVRPDASAQCKGQKNSKKYAADTEVLSTKGGALCVPVFGGFSGTTPYAPASPSIKVTLTTSTSDYNGKLPQLGKGTALLYSQFSFAAETTFGKKARGDYEITGSQISPGKAYTLFGQFIIDGKKTNKSPCYAVASKGQHGGVFNAGPGIENSSISAHTLIIAEIYPGKQASTPCS